MKVSNVRWIYAIMCLDLLFIKPFVMSYPLTLLKTAADCDAVLKFAGDEKADQEIKKILLDRAVETTSEDTLELEAELTSLESEITNLETLVAGLPEGSTSRSTNEDKLEQAKYRRYVLRKRRNKKGFLSQFERQVELTGAENSITVLEELIGQVTEHKATLS